MAIGGTVVALVAAGIALTVLPASLAVLGDRVNGGSLARWRRASARDARPAHEGPWYRIARGVMRRPALVAVATATFLVLVGLPFLRVNFVSADQRMLPAAAEAREVADFVERDVPGAAADPIRVVATARPDQAPDVAAYRDAVARVPHVGQVAPPRRLDATRWLIEAVPRGDAQDEQNLDAVRAVRRLPAAFPIAVGGSGAAFLDQQRALGDHLPMAIALLAITTFTILFLMTGSVVLPLKALLMNALSLSAAFGLLVLVFQDGRLEGLLDFRSAGGLEATQPVLLFAIAFGLATDYGVFLLSRIKEARDAGMGDRDAVAFGVERTGRIITAAALLFCVAVGAFATSGVLFIKQLGVGTAMAVAIDATIIRALLVPALMTLLGRWNWWAPRPLKRLHARVGLVDA
jgi:RND superfamily putative drug exporter